MEAKSTYISIETAKLLKDCHIASKYFYVICTECVSDGEEEEYRQTFDLITASKLQEVRLLVDDYYPAYTWQEIMWEHYEDFFPNTLEYFETIVMYLRSKLYEQADIYFRNNCILIKR